jgi:CSLREA domain-containing protein
VLGGSEKQRSAQQNQYTIKNGVSASGAAHSREASKSGLTRKLNMMIMANIGGKMKNQSTLILASLAALGVGLTLMWMPPSPAHASTPIIVNTTLDETDPSDGKCSLREAIIAANTNKASGIVAGECAAGSLGMDTINITATGTIAILGYLPDITDTLAINGPAGRITISGRGVTRSGFSLDDNVTLNLSNLTIADGYFPIGFGGAMALSNGSVLNVTNSTFSNNYSAYSGGAIWSGISPTSTVNISGSTFYSNTAGPTNPGLGGAIYSVGPLTITNSTFYSNSVIGTSNQVGGGAIYGYSNTLAITNTTFTANTSTGPGSAIYTSGSNVTTIINSTLSRNNGTYAALFTNGTTTLTNTIVANNSGGNCAGTITNGGYNLRWPSTDTSCVGAFGDPKLAPLGNYGGSTKTMGLFIGSAAIDAVLGGCPPPATDQRGVTRPQGVHCDIGAFEGTLYPLYLPIIER